MILKSKARKWLGLCHRTYKYSMSNYCDVIAFIRIIHVVLWWQSFLSSAKHTGMFVVAVIVYQQTTKYWDLSQNYCRNRDFPDALCTNNSNIATRGTKVQTPWRCSRAVGLILYLPNISEWLRAIFLNATHSSAYQYPWWISLCVGL